MFQILGIIICILFAIIVILLIASAIHHKNQLRKEAKAYFPSDHMVEIHGKKLHVYSEGKGDLTLVFMAGHGTHHPVLDFKPLWMRMAEDYRIAVVEKSGYGWSEVSNTPRDMDTLLEETRRALEQSGEKGPYVLLPHSMSGLEAIYWAQKYPEEVKAIIGLDPCTPQAVDILPKPEKTKLYAMYMISRTGLSRYMPDAEIEKLFPLMQSKDLTEEEKKKYIAAFYRSAFSKDMLREVHYLKENAETIAKNEVPINTPMYFFISEDQEASVIGWQAALSDYLSKMVTGKSLSLAAGHYIHYDKSDIIAKEAKAFLENIKK